MNDGSPVLWINPVILIKKNWTNLRLTVINETRSVGICEENHSLSKSLFFNDELPPVNSFEIIAAPPLE